jgi:rRNA maturation RNase YbeY
MISFVKQEIEFEFDKFELVKKVIAEKIELEKWNLSELNYIFMSDDDLLEVNRQYLNHDYYTDIITFNYNKRRNLAGDMYISIDTIISNAEKFNKTFENEFLRVIFHGLLHLLGYDDKNEKDQEIMTQQEEICLELFFSKLK